MSNVNIKARTQGLAVQLCVWGRCLLIQYRIILRMYSSSRLEHAAYLSNEASESFCTAAPAKLIWRRRGALLAGK